MTMPFNPFTQMHTLNQLQTPQVHFSSGPVSENQRDRNSQKSCPEARRAECSRAERFDVVYCFKHPLTNNLCKQGRPIPHKHHNAFFSEAVAPHCPHQCAWWIDVWVWYLIKLAQLQNRGTCVTTKATLHHGHRQLTDHNILVTGVTWAVYDINRKRNCGS